MGPRAVPRSSAPPRRRRRLLIALVVAVVLLLVGVAAGLMVITRMETGQWKVPNPLDLVRIIKGEPRPPARIIFLERKPVEIRPGADDSSRLVSSVLDHIRTSAAPHTHTQAAPAPGSATPSPAPHAPKVTTPAKLPGWKGSAKAWTQVMACVQRLFEPFDVEVVDTRPTSGHDFVLVAVGGRPTDIGSKQPRVGGLAPFHGGVIAKPIVYAFAAQLDHDVRAVCETIGMEVAHTYGLDHGYLCGDVMTYLEPCGTKRFVDQDVRCGETKPRDCEGGAPTQNSYRRLLGVLGPRRATPPATAKPAKPAKSAR